MTTATVARPHELRGEIAIPGDKSISHRAVMFASLAGGLSSISNFLTGDDCLATVACMRALGAEITVDQEAGRVSVRGAGARGLTSPEHVLDARNSGTTMRLLSGLLAGLPINAVLTGDDSLRRRPMGRIVKPLKLMGAEITGEENDQYAPIVIHGGGLRGIEYVSPVASAQVKSAILLAGLHADGPTTVVEPARSRDHTERMLQAMGGNVLDDGERAVTINPTPSSLTPIDIAVPGDISSAAFWLVAAACHPDAKVTLRDVGVNPTRSGVLHVLRRMGARISIDNERLAGGEPVADITVESSDLQGAEISGDEIPSLIDEIPLLAVAAATAEGATVIRDAAELRVKESDRIADLKAILEPMATRIEERPDGMTIHGGIKLNGAHVDPKGDHRLVMTAAVAGLLADGVTVISGPDAAAVSYPNFWRDLNRLRGDSAA